MSPELVVLGNLAVDDIVYSDGSTRMAQAGGAALYFALGARIWEADVAIVSRIGSDYPQDTLESLVDSGIDLSGVNRIAGGGLRTWLLYEGELRRVIHRLDSTDHLEASPEAVDVPPEWQPRFIHVAPLPIELQQKIVEDLDVRCDAEISVDPYELLSEVTLGAFEELVRSANRFFLSEDEIAVAEWRAEPMPTLRRLPAGKLKTLLFKRGSHGGMGLDLERDAEFRWVSHSTRVVDPTGAGDAFAGGTIAGLMQGESAEEAVRRGVVSASFAIEARGTEALLAATPDAAILRLQQWYGPDD